MLRDRKTALRLLDGARSTLSTTWRARDDEPKVSDIEIILVYRREHRALRTNFGPLELSLWLFENYRFIDSLLAGMPIRET